MPSRSRRPKTAQSPEATPESAPEATSPGWNPFELGAQFLSDTAERLSPSDNSGPTTVLDGVRARLFGNGMEAENDASERADEATTGLFDDPADAPSDRELASRWASPWMLGPELTEQSSTTEGEAKVARKTLTGEDAIGDDGQPLMRASAGRTTSHETQRSGLGGIDEKQTDKVVEVDGRDSTTTSTVLDSRRSRGRSALTSSRTTETSRDSVKQTRESLAAELRGAGKSALAEEADEAQSMAQLRSLARKGGVDVSVQDETRSRTDSSTQLTDVDAWSSLGVKHQGSKYNTSKTVTDYDGSTHTTGRSATTSLAVKDGLTVSSSIGRTHEKTEKRENALGEEYDAVTERSNVSATGRRRWVASEESGVGLGGGGEASYTGTNGSGKLSADGALTTKGAEAKGSGEAGWTNNEGIKLGGTITPSGKLRLDVSYDEAKDKYLVKVSINVGGSLSVDGSGDSTEHPDHTSGNGASGSVSVGGGWSRGFERTRLLSPEEAKDYIGNVEKIDEGKKAGTRPEFGILERWMAGLPLAGLSVDAEDARSLKAGEAITITDTSSASLGLSGSAKAGDKDGASAITMWGADEASKGSSASVSGKHERKWIRTLTVKHVMKEVGSQKLPATAVTVSLKQADESGLDLALKDGVTSGGIGGTSSDSSGDSVTFELLRDDQFDARFARLSDVDTVEGLRALARDESMGGASGFGTSSSEGSGLKGNLDVGGLFKFDVANSSSVSHEQKFDADGLAEGSATGQATDSAGMKLGLLGSTHKQTVKGTGTANKDGLALSLSRETEQSTSSPGNMPGVISKGLESFGDKNLEDQAGTLGSLANNGIRGVLDKAMTETEKHLVTVDLTPAQSRILSERAQNVSRWQGCAVWSEPKVFVAWDALGERLRSDAVPASLVREIKSTKEQYGQEAELSSQEWEVMRNLARARAFADYSELGNDVPLHNAVFRWGEDSGMVTADIASITEWPESLADDKKRFTRHDKRVKGLLVAQDKGSKAWNMRRKASRRELQKVRASVAASTDFTEIRAQARLLGAIDEVLGTLANAAEERPMQEPQDQRDALKRMGTRFADYRKQESRLLRDAADTFINTFTYDASGASKIIRQVADLHDVWKEELGEARDLAEITGGRVPGPKPREDILDDFEAFDTDRMEKWRRTDDW